MPKINDHKKRHLAALRKLARGPVTDATFDLLREIERDAHGWAEHCCNYGCSDSMAERMDDEFRHRVANALGRSRVGWMRWLRINGDPRGYALKVIPEHAPGGKVPDGMTTDWGGFGILAPDPDTFA